MSLSGEDTGLAERVRRAALLEGDFTLSSGERSRFYVDKYLFSTEPRLLWELAGELSRRLPEGVDRLAGVELGAVPLVVALSLRTGIPYVIVRRSAKDYGTARNLEGGLRAGEKIALVEDVVTTGAQALQAARGLVEAGCGVEKLLAVLDRRESPGADLGEFPFEALLRMADLGVENRD
ncbi:orotate phosphoribosyltransferase [Rubrobacter aplysinae]|uniref:orotate phosphoribosyltransferase n=1 Tax=Rubrobacter aplysinae TaxID=909625 RepID=UPI00064BD867|nr:orotate phosphoribosyltransferase [Rubrobacter aplysinae]